MDLSILSDSKLDALQERLLREKKRRLRRSNAARIAKEVKEKGYSVVLDGKAIAHPEVDGLEMLVMWYQARVGTRDLDDDDCPIRLEEVMTAEDGAPEWPEYLGYTFPADLTYEAMDVGRLSTWRNKTNTEGYDATATNYCWLYIPEILTMPAEGTRGALLVEDSMQSGSSFTVRDGRFDCGEDRTYAMEELESEGYHVFVPKQKE